MTESPYFFFKLGKEERDGAIDADGMTVIIGGVVSERSQGKCIAVKVFGIAEESQDEVAAAHVVRQIAEEEASMRVVTHVLDDGAAIGITVRFFDFVRGRAGKTLQQERANIGVPDAINDRFMGQDGVGASLAGIAQGQGQDQEQDQDRGRDSYRKEPLCPSYCAPFDFALMSTSLESPEPGGALGCSRPLCQDSSGETFGCGPFPPQLSPSRWNLHSSRPRTSSCKAWLTTRKQCYDSNTTSSLPLSQVLITNPGSRMGDG